jgi:ABC-type antimicrobial peptide transport system permease subunit
MMNLSEDFPQEFLSEISVGSFSDRFLLFADHFMQCLTFHMMSHFEVFPIRKGDHLTSYLYAGGLTLIFALIVQIITNRSLDEIDPVTALKSAE